MFFALATICEQTIRQRIMDYAELTVREMENILKLVLPNETAKSLNRPEVVKVFSKWRQSHLFDQGTMDTFDRLLNDLSDNQSNEPVQDMTRNEILMRMEEDRERVL